MGGTDLGVVLDVLHMSSGFLGTAPERGGFADQFTHAVAESYHLVGGLSDCIGQIHEPCRGDGLLDHLLALVADHLVEAPFDVLEVAILWGQSRPGRWVW